MEVPVNFTGGNYQEKSRPLSNQFTRNFWPKVIATEKAESRYVLESFYGLKLWASEEGSADRGMLENQGKLYKITDTKFCEVLADGTHNELGRIPGSNRCIMKALDAQIIIANGSGAIYVWDGTNLTRNSSPNLGLPNGVSVLNNKAIYDSGSGQRFDVSDTNEPLVIDGLNNAQAESSPDQLLLTVAYKETLYLMGEKTIELWWDSGQGNPPLEKIQGAIIQQGLGAIHSVAETPDFLIYFGTDDSFHTLTGGTASIDEVISTPAMTRQIQKYNVKDDCIGWTFEIEEQWFYAATFPTENVTWLLPLGGEWFQWGDGIRTGRTKANSYAKAFGKNLMAEFDSGDIYELDPDTYTHAGETVVRTRDSAPLTGTAFQKPGAKFEITELEIVLETGIGNLQDPGKDPIISISTSRDGGKTFGTERFINTGKLGETDRIVRLKSLGQFRNCVFRLRVSDPVFWSIYNGRANIELCE